MYNSIEEVKAAYLKGDELYLDTIEILEREFDMHPHDAEDLVEKWDEEKGGT